MSSINNPTRVVTGEVRLSYANIFAKSIQGGKPKYSVSLIIPKSDTETLKKIERAIDAAIEAGIGKFGGKKPNKAALKLALRDGDIDRDDEAYADAMFVNANSTTPPQVVDGDLQPILDSSEVYSGCYARVSVSFYAVQYEREQRDRVRAGQHPKAPRWRTAWWQPHFRRGRLRSLHYQRRFLELRERKTIMNECYAAALSANTTTLVSLFVGAVLGWILWEIVSLIVEWWKIRRDRKRLEQLMAESEAEREKYRTPTNQ